jgi:hypothetical protein
MKTKNVHESVEKPKNFFAKVGETRIWKKLFVSQTDYEKVEELKREAQIKYGMMRF